MDRGCPLTDSPGPIEQRAPAQPRRSSSGSDPRLPADGRVVPVAIGAGEQVHLLLRDLAHTDEYKSGRDERETECEQDRPDQVRNERIVHLHAGENRTERHEEWSGDEVAGHGTGHAN